MKVTIRTTEEAVQALIAAATRPPQIDYVSPADRAKQEEAEQFIQKLPRAERLKAESEIENTVSGYYSEDGSAQYDALF